ncbi:MAG: ankyrin repeat domain-containing protein, partial [Bacteroidales bacterium]
MPFLTIKLYKHYSNKIFFFFFFSITLSYYTYAQNDSLTKSDINYNLLLAAYNGKADSIVYWLNLGADPNTVSSDGISALNYAIQSGQLDAVKALVFNGADVNYSSPYSLPPLFLAIAYNQAATVEFLIKKGAKVDKLIKNKISALHYAVKYADSSIIALLLQNHINPLSTDEDGNTVMMGLIYFKRYDLLPYFDTNETLIKFPDNNGLTPFLLAVQIGDTTMADYLLKIGANINDKTHNGYGLMEYALISKSQVMLNWALKKKELLKNYYDHDLIKLAYYIGNKELVKFFRQNGFKPYLKPVIQCLHLGNTVSFNHKDMLWGLRFGIFESHYGFNVGINFQTRLWSNRILMDLGNNTYYQFWERRSLWGVYFQKRALLKSDSTKKWYLNFGANEYITYGKYRGAYERPESYYFLSPLIELMQKRNFVT